MTGGDREDFDLSRFNQRDCTGCGSHFGVEQLSYWHVGLYKTTYINQLSDIGTCQLTACVRLIRQGVKWR